MDVFDGRQLTAARALAELTVIDLAEAASVTAKTINRLEVGGVVHVAPKKRHGHVSQDVWGKIIDALARHGVELLPEESGHGAGVRWMQQRGDRAGIGGTKRAGGGQAAGRLSSCRSQKGRSSFFRNQQQTDRLESYFLRSRGM